MNRAGRHASRAAAHERRRQNDKIVAGVCADPRLVTCPYKHELNGGTSAGGTTLIAMGGPLMLVGAGYVAGGVSGRANPGDKVCCSLEIAVPILVTGLVFEAIGIPLTVAGANDRHWVIKRGRQMVCLVPGGIAF